MEEDYSLLENAYRGRDGWLRLIDNLKKKSRPVDGDARVFQPAGLIAEQLELAGMDELVVVDLHRPQIESF